MIFEGEAPKQDPDKDPVNVTVYLNAPMIFPSTAPEPEAAPDGE